MRHFLLLLLLCLAVPNQAQETGWPVTENCLGELPYPTIPQDDWDFEGVIFSHNSLGVRAIRTDVETSYFIAFEDDENFPAAGGFSPDGRWFAYPTGQRDDNVNSGGDSIWFINGFAVVSTDPSNLRQEFEFAEFLNEGTFFFESSSGGYQSQLYHIMWLDNEEFVYLGANDPNAADIDAPLILNHNTGIYNPDRGIDEQLKRDADAYVDAIWLPHNNGSIELSFGEYPSVLRWYDNNGEIRETIMEAASITGLALSPDMQTFGFFKDNQLHLANLGNRTIENLCLEVPYRGQFGFPEILWSPDGNYLAFRYDGYPVLLNLATREMQILRYETGSLMGWYPIPEN